MSEKSEPSSSKKSKGIDERLKVLYPMVIDSETPLPRKWSSEDKAALIELSQDDLRAHGPGSVRANDPIPSHCPGYYFEVKIVSRSAVVGLTATGTNGNSMDR